MARRDLQALLASEARNDREEDVNPFAMAMQLLGVQAQRKQLAGEREFEREKLSSEEQRAANALGLQTRQQTETELAGAEARRIAALQEQRLADLQKANLEQAGFMRQLEQQKVIANALDKVAGVQTLTPEAQAMIEQLPGVSERLTTIRGQQNLEKTLPELQLAYTEPDAAKRDAAIRAVYGKMSQYARENAPWQDLNALVKPEVPRPVGQTPTTVGTISRDVVNPALAQGEAGRRAQMAQRPVATPTEFAYEEGYPSAQPDYMYGIQTPIPADVINRVEADPRYMTAEQELLMKLKDWWNQPRSLEASQGVGWRQ